MAISRRSLAETYEAQDLIIQAAQDVKREATKAYREHLDGQGMDKDAIKAEVEGFKKAFRRKMDGQKKGTEAVEHVDAIADEIYLEITAPRAPRVTRVEIIEEFDAETGEITEPQPTKAAGQGLAEPALSLGSSQPANTKSAPITEPQSAPQAARDLATSPSPQGQVATHSDIGMPISNEAPFPSADGGANIGGDHEVPAHSEPVVFPGRHQSEPASEVAQSGDEHQRAEHSETNEAPAGRVADESPASNYLNASTGDAQFRDPLDWEDEDGALPIQSHRAETPEGQRESALCDKADMTGKTAGADAPAAPDNTIIFKAKPLRPNCLKPEACAGQGRNHCWPCRKAMAEEGAE